MRKGFTTGAAATAAAKAAAILLAGSQGPEGRSRRLTGFVEIQLPDGKKICLKIQNPELRTRNSELIARASVIKDAGDDPDVTNGMEIIAEVKKLDHAGDIVIKGGEGVGVVTKPGLQIPVGEAAINPVPIEMIKKAVREVLPEGGILVEISVPRGREVAEKTFNQRLGIVGGISIIGTTGIVEPMSLEALEATIRCEIDVAWEEVRGASSALFLAPGKIGENALKRLFGDIRVVQMSNFVGFALEYAREKGIADIVIGGHPGKLAKIMMGYFDTHSGNSPQATGFVAEFLGLNSEFNTVEEIIQSVQKVSGSGQTFFDLAAGIAEAIRDRFGFRTVEICLFDMKKELTGRGKCTG